MTEPKLPKTRTKDVIYKDYERLLAIVNEQAATNLNPAQVKRAKRKKQIMAQTDGISLDQVEKSVGSLRNRLMGALNDIEISLKSEVEQLSTVQESLGYKQEEVKEIFDIEHEAGSLAALIQTQNERKEVFSREMSERRTTFDEEQHQVRKTWTDEVTEYQRQRALQTQQDEAERTRSLEEHKYTFERSERERLDALADSLTEQRKRFNESVETEGKILGDREEDLAKREAVVSELEAKVVQLESDIETKVAEAIEKTKSGMNASNHIAQSSIRKDYEAQLTVANGKLETTAEQLDDSRNRITSLEGNLSAARAEVQAVAMRALDAQPGKAALEALQTANAQAQTKR